jgi:hypothetical protein
VRLRVKIIEKQAIVPQHVTKPMQLLAAWLVGLVLTNGTFLASAGLMVPGSSERLILIWAAVLNVPLFLVSLFQLQTRFRAELQDDTFYSEYLSKKTAQVVRIDRDGSLEKRLDELEQVISAVASSRRSSDAVLEDVRAANEVVLRSGTERVVQLEWAGWRVGVNKLHPRYEQIREELRAAGVPVAAVFGGEDAAEAPETWVVALSYSLPLDHKLSLLQVAAKFEFDGFQLWRPDTAANETEDAYLGAYGAKPFAPMTPAFLRHLDRGMDAAELAYYFHAADSAD